MIKLTKEHEQHLIEMIDKLFPEYVKTIINNGDWDDSLPGILHLHTEYDDENGFYSYQSIHWFEFCVTILLKRIILYNRNEKSLNDFTWTEMIKLDGSLQDDYNDQLINMFPCEKFTEHSIDYLYKQLKYKLLK